MIAGVPGAGISAFFYLLCVMAMPFVAVFRAVRARSLDAGRWRLLARQTLIALGIAGGLVAGGAMLTLLATSASAPVTGEQAGQLAWQVGATLGRVGIGLGLATLALVLGTVQLWAALELIRRRRSRPAGPVVRLRSRRELQPVWSATELPQRRGGSGRQHTPNAPRE